MLDGALTINGPIAAKEPDTLPADRSHLRCREITDADGLARIAADIEGLMENAIYGSPAFSSSFLTSAFNQLADPRIKPLVVALYRDHPVNGSTLVGLFGCTRKRFRWGLPLPLVHGWQHAFSFLGAPLIHRDYASEAINGFLDWQDHDTDESHHLLLNKMPTEGALYDLFQRVAKQRDRQIMMFDRHERAAYDATRNAQDYVDKALVRKRRKEWRRLRRRLAETGELTSVALSEEDDVAAWCDAFFELELSGWKGRAGTAIACDDNARAYTQAGLIGEAKHGRLRFWKLALDGKPIAMAFATVQPPQAWLMKITYDEAFAKYSPGVLLIFDIMESLSAEPDIAVADSCAIPDHPMIDHLWQERIGMADFLLTADSTGALEARLIHRLETLRRSTRESAKRLYHTLKKGSRP